MCVCTREFAFAHVKESVRAQVPCESDFCVAMQVNDIACSYVYVFVQMARAGFVVFTIDYRCILLMYCTATSLCSCDSCDLCDLRSFSGFSTYGRNVPTSLLGPSAAGLGQRDLIDITIEDAP